MYSLIFVSVDWDFSLTNSLWFCGWLLMSASFLLPTFWVSFALSGNMFEHRNELAINSKNNLPRKHDFTFYTHKTANIITIHKWNNKKLVKQTAILQAKQIWFCDYVKLTRYDCLTPHKRNCWFRTIWDPTKVIGIIQQRFMSRILH